ncbi:HNH endonuclease [Gemmatimonadota bacterium]
MRADIFNRDAYRCVYCARVFTDTELTLDHVQPLVKGGDHSPGNLVTACAHCNSRKGGHAAWAWLKDKPDERQNFLAPRDTCLAALAACRCRSVQNSIAPRPCGPKGFFE